MSVSDTTYLFDRELTPEELQELSKVISESIGRITSDFSKPLKDVAFKSFENSFEPLLDFCSEISTNLSESALESTQKLSSAYAESILHRIDTQGMNDAISSLSRKILSDFKGVTINSEVFMPSLMNLQKQLTTVPTLDEYVAVSRTDLLNICNPLNLDTGLTDESSDSKFVLLSSERLKKILFEILLVLIPMLHTQYLHNCDVNQSKNELQMQQEFYEEQLDSQKDYYEQSLKKQQNYYEQQLGINQEYSNLLNQILQALQCSEDDLQDSEENTLPSDETSQQIGQTPSVPREALTDTPEFPESDELSVPTHTVDK